MPTKFNKGREGYATEFILKGLHLPCKHLPGRNVKFMINGDQTLKLKKKYFSKMSQYTGCIRVAQRSR